MNNVSVEQVLNKIEAVSYTHLIHLPMGQVGYRLFRFAIGDSIGIYKDVCKKQLSELSETSGV